jgi:hypothetical protein
MPGAFAANTPETWRKASTDFVFTSAGWLLANLALRLSRAALRALSSHQYAQASGRKSSMQIFGKRCGALIFLRTLDGHLRIALVIENSERPWLLPHSEVAGVQPSNLGGIASATSTVARRGGGIRYCSEASSRPTSLMPRCAGVSGLERGGDQALQLAHAEPLPLPGAAPGISRGWGEASLFQLD